MRVRVPSVGWCVFEISESVGPSPARLTPHVRSPTFHSSSGSTRDAQEDVHVEMAGGQHAARSPETNLLLEVFLAASHNSY